jgi:hypothetical protein
MSKDPVELHRIAHKSYGNLISDGFSLFMKTYKSIIIPIGLFFIISIILREILLVDLRWDLSVLEVRIAPILNSDPSSVTPEALQLMMNYLMSSLGLIVLELLISNIFTVLGLCAVAAFLFKYYNYQDTSLREEIKGAFNKKMIPILLLLGLGIPLGIFTLFIVSIIIFGFFIFSIYTYQLKDNENPLKSARAYSKGAFWRIIGVLVISSLITYIINFIYQFIFSFAWPVNSLTLTSWYNPSSRRLDLLILYGIAQNLIPLLLEPLFICLLTPVFTSAYVKNQLSYGITAEPHIRYSPMNRSLKEPQISDKGIYCPFCGNYMEFKLNFCPNCGEKLNFEV